MAADRPSSSTGRPVHLIPDDGLPHAETSECGCGPAVALQALPGGGTRRVYRHQAATMPPDFDDDPT